MGEKPSAPPLNDALDVWLLSFSSGVTGARGTSFVDGDCMGSCESELSQPEV